MSPAPGNSGCDQDQDDHDGRRQQDTSRVERLGYLDILASVRAFYLDLAEWALDDPARWGPWVAPCPIAGEDLQGKFTRRRKARMDARTRERLPVLPVLARAAAQSATTPGPCSPPPARPAPGATFTAAGQTLIRSAGRTPPPAASGPTTRAPANAAT